MSASPEMVLCDTMKSHVPATAGYWPFGRGETETESVSHRFAMVFTSSRVNVNVVVARAAVAAANRAKTATTKLRTGGGIERRRSYATGVGYCQSGRCG